MLRKTKGIVLHSFKYGESGIIARILTQQMGLQSFLVHGVRKSKSRNKANLFQPLTLVDLVVYAKENESLHNIKEIRCSYPFRTIGTDIRKTSIAIFISEMLLNAYKHQDMQEEAFDFIYKAAQQLDIQENNIAGFHLIFLLHLSKFLGFFPARNYTTNRTYFNLQEGLYQETFDHSTYCLGQEESQYFFNLSHPEAIQNMDMPITASMRTLLLSKIITYYKLHLEGFKEVKSLIVLESVFK